MPGNNRQDRPFGYPTSFLGSLKDRPEIYDPALRHYPLPYRLGEPRFSEEQGRLYWEVVQQRAMTHLLSLTKAASWKDGPILRGSVVLRHYLGIKARAPRDLDWLVLPTTWKPNSREARLFFDDVLSRLRREPEFEGGEFQPYDVLYDEIWVYDKTPGQRLVFPWQGPNLPRGLVQMDFAFQELMPTEPVLIHLPGVGAIRTASLEQCLAWKLFWLEKDSRPQGKDLYDATLIAEHLSAAGTPYSFDLPDSLTDGMNWGEFTREYPAVKGDLQTWTQRLQAALTL